MSLPLDFVASDPAAQLADGDGEATGATEEGAGGEAGALDCAAGDAAADAGALDGAADAGALDATALDACGVVGAEEDPLAFFDEEQPAIASASDATMAPTVRGNRPGCDMGTPSIVGSVIWWFFAVTLQAAKHSEPIR